MSQSSKIFGAVFIGFLVFVTIKGELPAYFAVVIGTAPSQAVTDATNSGGGGYNPATVDQSVTGTTAANPPSYSQLPVGSYCVLNPTALGCI